MVALSMALAFLGCLAFAGFVLWLRRGGDAKRIEVAVGKLGERVGHAHESIRFIKTDAERDAALVEALTERVGKVELALGVKRMERGG